MVNILGISVYDKTIPDAVEEVTNICLDKNAAPNNYCISATGAHGIISAKEDKSFRDILNGFYMNLPDGMPNVWVGRMKGAKAMRRCYGPDFFAALMEYTADKPINHFFCGGKEGVADDLKAACAKKFGNSHVTGTFCPPFRAMTDAEFTDLAKQIEASQANVVWIGISTPKQEKFAWQLRNFAKTKFIITVGAAFDFHTDRLDATPRWVQKIGMEWFYRMAKEPKRLFKRYVEIVPKFIVYNIFEVFAGSKKA